MAVPSPAGVANPASNEVPSPSGRGGPVRAEQRDRQRVRAGLGGRGADGDADPDAVVTRREPADPQDRHPIPSAWSLPPLAWTASARNASTLHQAGGRLVDPGEDAADHQVEPELELLVGGALGEVPADAARARGSLGRERLEHAVVELSSWAAP